MSQTSDITSRIRERFLKEVADEPSHRRLAKPLDDILSDSKPPTPDQLVAIYQESADNAESAHKNATENDQ